MLSKDIRSKITGWVKKIQNNRQLPEKIVILLTIPRSGSTWLFDVLRCHPAVLMHPTAAIFKRLDLNGRRYPMDLSGGQQATQWVEVRLGQWERIPEFKIIDGQKYVSPQLVKEPYAIEKCHPSFFNNDVKRFLVKLTRVKKVKKVKLVYQVRDPKAALVSFLQYQQRNPSWYASLNQDQLPKYLRQIYNSTLEVALSHPGLVINYNELVNNFQKVVGKLLDYLELDSIDPNNELRTELIKLMAAKTDREKRKSEATKFLGDKSGPVSVSGSELESYFSKQKHELDRCYQIYHSLLQLARKAA
jgi:hypothetical protein